MFRFDFLSRVNIQRPLPNRWDMVALLLIVVVFLSIAQGVQQMTDARIFLDSSHIHLDMPHLIYYAYCSIFRMFLALFLALIVTFFLGYIAAKSHIAQLIIIPLIDVLQSVPVIAFLQISVFFSAQLFPGQMLGAELAALLAIFVAQAWNMILSFYQSLQTVPSDYNEMARLHRFSRWQYFWRVEVPFARPGLLFNMMLSLSASWFAVVESEAFHINRQQVYLPGIGSYIKVAQEQGDTYALAMALVMIAAVIVVYDQLLFRPLQAWINRYEGHSEQSWHWLLTLFARTRWLAKMGDSSAFHGFCQLLMGLLLAILAMIGFYLLQSLVMVLMQLNLDWQLPVIVHDVDPALLLHLFFLGLISALRIYFVLLLCLLLALPLGIMIGARLRFARMVQPFIQLIAAFPPNALYPLVMYAILTWPVHPEIGIIPLIMMGSVWYILFNIVAGMQQIPKELRLAVKSLHLPWWLQWRRLYIPAVFPHAVTGLMSASGAAWNCTIMAEIFSWHGQTVAVSGLGAYMKIASSENHSLEVAWSVIVMCIWVMLINIMVWQPLHAMVRRYYC